MFSGSSGAQDLADVPVRTLSRGLQQRVSIARAIVRDRQLLPAGLITFAPAFAGGADGSMHALHVPAARSASHVLAVDGDALRVLSIADAHQLPSGIHGSLAASLRWTRGAGLPLPKHLLERPYLDDKAGFLEHPYWNQEFVGTGPFKLREWVKGSVVSLVANEEYVLGRPKIDEVEVRFIADGAGTRVELEHRGWERVGAEATEVREAYDSPRGWVTTLNVFAGAIDREVA